MNKRVVAPLVLLSSITLLTSCMNKEEKTPVVTPTAETTAPVEVVTDTPTATPADTSPTGIDAGAIPPSGVAPAPEANNQAPAALTKKETVSYVSPAGNETIELSVSVADGVITAVTATPQATNEISKKLQTSFSEKVSAQVVGKKISDLGADAIGGASLTTGAFKNFVQSF